LIANTIDIREEIELGHCLTDGFGLKVDLSMLRLPQIA
jgi:hypothetical protein